MELKLRVAKFEARLMETESKVFGTKREAENAARSLRKTRRELIRLGARVTAAEIRVREIEGGGWRVEGTGGNWRELELGARELKGTGIGEGRELEGTGRNWRELEGTGEFERWLERLED